MPAAQIRSEDKGRDKAEECSKIVHVVLWGPRIE
jgi:hypothetical protein